MATSRELITKTHGGETVEIKTIVNGAAEDTETIKFPALDDLNSIIKYWNQEAKLTEAFRSTSTGKRNKRGRHLSIVSIGEGGTKTILNYLKGYSLNLF